MRTYRRDSMSVQFHFFDNSMTDNVMVIKSGVWTNQAQQDWCYSLSMHALTDIAQKVCKKNKTRTTTNTNKRRVLVETENNSVVWTYLAMYGGKSSPEGHEPAGQKSKSVQKPTYCCFFCVFFPLKVAIPAYYTWIPLSLSIHVLPSEFASRS